MAIDFKELANAQVSETRTVVISETKTGTYTIGQKLKVIDGDRVNHIFLKGALYVPDKDGLQKIRDAINVALSAGEPKKKTSKK